MMARGLRKGATIQHAVGYIRVSSEEQARADRWSLEAQRKAIELYCQQRGWTLQHLYCDAGHSAKGSDFAKRPDFKRMLEDVTGGKVRCDVIVTHTLDRYARNLVVALTTLASLHEQGITYSSVTESDFDYSNPDRRLHLSILAMFAEYFSEKLSQHTKKGKKERAAHGLYNGDLPYGYANPDAGTPRSGAGVSNSTVPVIVPDRAEAVRRAFELYASGQYSDQRVAHALNAEGYRMVSKRHPDGYPFTKDTVTAMLQMPLYTGLVTYCGDGTRRHHEVASTVEGKHEAIIDRALFQRVQAIRAGKRHKGHASSPTRHAGVYVGAGLVRCRCCRQALCANARGQRQPFYRDRSRMRGIDCDAKRQSIPISIVEQALSAWVGAVRLPDDWRAYALDVTGEDDAARRREAERIALTRKQERLNLQFREGFIDEAEYRAEMSKVQAQLDILTSEQHSTVDLDDAAQRLRDLLKMWGEGTPEQRRDIAAALFEAIYCDLDTHHVVAVQLRGSLKALKPLLPTRVYSCGTDEIRYPMSTLAFAHELDDIAA